MPGWEKWLWGGLGWALGGPIGGLLGFALGAMRDQGRGTSFIGTGNAYPRTRPGDFGVSLLVLFAAVMRADKELRKSELNYIKEFFVQTFGDRYAQERMVLFKEILQQDYPLGDVCRQIRRNMDHPARLELLHLLFGLARADGAITTTETEVIGRIAHHLGISEADFGSIRAMFVEDASSAYRILEIDADADQDSVKKAYRKMASKYHPDKVSHLGEEFQKVAEDKFKAINSAYQEIRRQRGWT